MSFVDPFRVIRGYALINFVGHGSFSKVYEAEHVRTHAICAIKMIPECHSERATTEINLISRFNHPAFPKFREAFSDGGFHSIVVDYVSNGTLLQHLNQRRTFSEPDARVVFTQIVEGVKYLHNELQIAHLDLKLENIMIDDMSQVKIIDFDGSAPLKELGKPLKRGSPAYWSPEIILGNPVTESTDIWCLGVLLYTLIHGKFPFQRVGPNFNLSILRDEVTFSEPSSPELNDLLHQMLQKDVKKRIGIDGIQNHPWMLNRHLEQCESSPPALALPALNFFIRRSPASIMIMSKPIEVPNKGSIRAVKSVGVHLTTPVVKNLKL
jgi:serine/threonine protein kinase